MNNHLRLLAILLILALNSASAHEPDSTAHYLANEGVMIVHGETKILFDPLFRISYGQYQMMPKDMEAALFAGEPPFTGIDAVFISHYHGDHFSPRDVLNLLKAHPAIKLYAPKQAVQGLRRVATDEESAVFTRVNSLWLQYKDTPVELEMDGLQITAVRIPHSGWPQSLLDVENIAYRVTLDDAVTVLHLGDADPNDIHFERDAEHWQSRHIDLALPPFWFFSSTHGPGVLKSRLNPTHSVGIHVPTRMPDNPADRPPEFQGFDLFTEPGETRIIKPAHQ
jgi:L-ascorbate metabolism protein UlaG (beta-lactamase superfamily)